jgi:hypothetical protein
MNFQEIKETVAAFQKSIIILTAYQLNIFTLIGEESQSAETISNSLNLNKSATEKYFLNLAK